MSDFHQTKTLLISVISLACWVYSNDPKVSFFFLETSFQTSLSVNNCEDYATGLTLQAVSNILQYIPWSKVIAEQDRQLKMWSSILNAGDTIHTITSLSHCTNLRYIWRFLNFLNITTTIVSASRHCLSIFKGDRGELAPLFLIPSSEVMLTARRL